MSRAPEEPIVCSCVIALSDSFKLSGADSFDVESSRGATRDGGNTNSSAYQETKVEEERRIRRCGKLGRKMQPVSFIHLNFADQGEGQREEGKGKAKEEGEGEGEGARSPLPELRCTFFYRLSVS